MGDLGVDTAVEGGEGRFAARLCQDWEIWGPNGGYVASIALRAAGAHSRFIRPATFSCHYLSAAAFDEVQLEVTTLRASRRAESLRVSMLQGDRHILEALVWTVAELQGLAHDTSPMPTVAPADSLPSFDERLTGGDWSPPFPFWNNIDYRPLDWVDDWENRTPSEPLAEGWFRFRPTSTFEDDPFLDAARSLLLADTMPWPAAERAYTGFTPFIAPSIDISVQFHRAAPTQEWLFVRAESPIAVDGLVGGTARVWSADGQLLATAVEQMLCVPAPPMP